MVCMLLSYALNSAIQKRKECLDQMTAFKKFNDEDIHWTDTFKVDSPKDGLRDEAPKDGDELKDGEDAPKDGDDTQKDESLEKCKCQCSPKGTTPSDKILEGLGEIIYSACLDLMKEDDEGNKTWDDKKIRATWKNLHLAASFVFEELVGNFQKLRDDESEELEADYNQYNDYGAIDMFSLKAVDDNPHDNRMFLLYSLVYCTLNPKQSKEDFLENFESYEKYWLYLRDVSLSDFVALVPLLRVFFKFHDAEMSKGHDGYWHKEKNTETENLHKYTDGMLTQSVIIKRQTEQSNIHNDLENLADFFLERSFLEQAYDSGYNVYTAANVYYLAHEVRKFLQQREEHKSTRKISSRSKLSCGKKSSEKEPLNQDIGKQDSTVKQYIMRSFFVSIFIGYDQSDPKETEKAQQEAEVQSSVERAIVCFVLQASLYLGCLLLSTDQVCYEDTGLLGWGMKDFISCVVLFFSFQFLVSMAISEFYINSFCIFLDPTTKVFQKVVLSLNFVVNSFLALTLIYSSALILKGSESFVDTILNSVAVFFVSELDDMLISELDEEKLEERSVQALIGIMRRCSRKVQKGTVNRLKNEQKMIKSIGLFSLLIMLPCSFVMYFSGSADCS